MLEAFGQLISDAEASPVAHRLTTLAPTWLVQFPSLVPAEQRETLGWAACSNTTTGPLPELKIPEREFAGS